MKRTVLSILMTAACLIGIAAQNDAVFVYRNDGAINAFLKADIDSIRYSHIGLDSLEHSEYMVQEVWTPDSVYRIPLADIDSVSFVTPPTVLKNDVTRLEETLLDYITGCDSLTLRLRADTPAHLLPGAGDKLALLDGCDALPYGFSGIVTEVRAADGGIDVVCTQAYLEDLFDSFCSVSTMYGAGDDTPVRVASSGRPDRVAVNPGDVRLNLGPYEIDRSDEFSAEVVPDGDLVLGGGASASVTISPVLRIHTFLIMGDGQGTYFNCSITGDINVVSKLSFYGDLQYDHDLEIGDIEIPIPYTYKLINFHIVPGLFGHIGAKASFTATDTRTYALGMAYDYSSIGANVMRPTLGCRLASHSREIESSIDGDVAFGAFVETGFNILSRELAKVYVRGEYGWTVKGEYVLLNSDIAGAGDDTRLYERLKASKIETGPFANVSLGASVMTSDISATLVEGETLKEWDIVPIFSGTEISREGSSTSADASVGMSGDCLLPVTVGFKLFDYSGNEVANFSSSARYADQGGTLSHCFVGVDKDRKYTVYPKVRLFGHDILAAPSAQLDSEGVHTCPDANHPHAIDLGLPSGTKWCCRNVGASSPEDSGGYYAWGETWTKNDYTWENYAYCTVVDEYGTYYYQNIGSEISGTQYDVAHVTMGGAWRMPTYEQIRELCKYCSWRWTQLNGVDGMLMTGPSGGQVFLPDGGCNGYWSGKAIPGNDYHACLFYVDPSGPGYGGFDRSAGLLVRPVCP